MRRANSAWRIQRAQENLDDILEGRLAFPFRDVSRLLPGVPPHAGESRMAELIETYTKQSDYEIAIARLDATLAAMIQVSAHLDDILN